MANSGYKNWLTLKKYVNGVATTETKTNTSGDADYIAPVLDEAACPTTSNSCPTVSSPMPNIAANAGAVSQTIDLDTVFSDLDGDTLTYTATSSNINAATVSVASNILTVSFSATTGGSSTISVTASDGTCSANDQFSVTVTEVSTACVTGLYSLLGIFKGATADIACSPTLQTATFLLFGNGTTITSSTNFYSTIDGCETYPAGFLSDGTNWVELNASGVKIDSGLCDAGAPPPAPEPTPYTGLTRCDNSTVTWYTSYEVNFNDGTRGPAGSGNTFWSAGQVCYTTSGTIYDISGKVFIDGTAARLGRSDDCDCDCYGINCGGNPLY